MPAWAGRWKGGRYYLEDTPHGPRPVYFIESNRPGIPRAVRLKAPDETTANGMLGLFRADPARFLRDNAPEVPAAPTAAVYITTERLNLYLASIRKAVQDHRDARKAYLLAWGELGLDLRTVDRRALRAALGAFPGGHRGRTEALNAFCRFLVREGDLQAWNPLVNTHDPEATRAERVAYTLDELHAAYKAVGDAALRDVMTVRLTTGLHHTEIEQLEGARVSPAPLQDKGVAVRTLGDGTEAHEIRGVVQIKQKKKPRHRVSVGAGALAAVLRLTAGVPTRSAAWKAFAAVGIVPSNLRHTWVTLCGEIGELVTYTGKGVDLDRIAEIAGHRPGSAMTGTRYDKLQVPPMIRLALPWLP